MTSLPSSIPARAFLLGSLLLAAGCTTTSVTPPPAAPAAPAPAPAKPVAEGAFDDDARPLSAAETAVNAAGLDPAKLAAVQGELLALIQKPGAEPAAVQSAAQQLGLVLLTGKATDHAAILNALAPMLTDPARSDFARLALDRVPGAGVDVLYLQALLSVTGRTQLGLIDAAGSRGIASAVPALAKLLGDSDPATSAAAARALGRIGGPAALEALAKAKDQASPVVLTARLAAAAKADAATAVQVAGDIYRNTAAPLAQRSAALRALIAANPAGALDEIHAALAGPDHAFHQVAIESVATLPVADAGAKLAGRLSAYTPAVQAALIAALGHRNDAGAAPGLLTALDSSDASVRLAAMDALGRLPGDVAGARKLAALATGKGDEAKAAAAALARLNGPGLDELVRAGATSGDDHALRAVFIAQIAARNLTDAIPQLLALRSSPVESLRLEALDALRLIGGPSDQPAVIAWATGAAAKTEQARAVRALITIVLRDGNTATRATTVIGALNAGDAAARQTLLPVLSRVAGAPALAAAAALARDADETVAAAATAELARWPDASALPALVDLAVATKVEATRTAAVQGAARYLSQRTAAIAANRSSQARALLELPLSPAAKQALINVLSLCADQPALDTAKKFATDPAVAALAKDAVEAIASSLAGPPVVTASVTTADPAAMGDGSATTFWQIQGNEPGVWIRADLHSTRPVRKLTLEHGGRGWGYPEAFDVQVSDNPDQPGDVVAQGEGDRGQSVVALPAGTRGRYVWVRITKHRDAPLAIAEIIVE